MTHGKRKLVMAHLLDFSLGSAAFAQLIGETAWHGFGQFVNPDASVDDWRKQARLEWDALSLPVGYTVPGLGAMQDEATRVIVRSDTGAVLGTATDGYHVHTIGEIFEQFRALCDSTEGGGWKMVTAGALKGGRIIWAQAKRDERAEVVPGDFTENYLFLQTSFDGSQRTGAAPTDVRIVCNNTRRQAWDGNKKKQTQSHRSKLDTAKLLQALGVSSDSFARSIAASQHLAKLQIESGEARELLRGLFGQPVKANRAVQPVKTDSDKGLIVGLDGQSLMAGLLAKPAATLSDTPKPATLDITDAKDHRNIGRIMQLFEGAGMGANIEGVRGTRWGLLNAVTEFADHQAGHKDETRVMSAQFGMNAKLKDRAFELLIDGTGFEAPAQATAS